MCDCLKSLATVAKGRYSKKLEVSFNSDNPYRKNNADGCGDFFFVLELIFCALIVWVLE